MWAQVFTRVFYYGTPWPRFFLIRLVFYKTQEINKANLLANFPNVKGEIVPCRMFTRFVLGFYPMALFVKKINPYSKRTWNHLDKNLTLTNFHNVQGEIMTFRVFTRILYNSTCWHWTSHDPYTKIKQTFSYNFMMIGSTMWPTECSEGK